jgi:hypothetical protein
MDALHPFHDQPDTPARPGLGITDLVGLYLENIGELNDV